MFSRDKVTNVCLTSIVAVNGKRNSTESFSIFIDI